MATAATLSRSNDAASSRSPHRARPPVPANYYCRSCGMHSHHWIMDCSALPLFRKDSATLTSDEGKTSAELPDELVQIVCSGSITECQSLLRILDSLQFYQSNAKNDHELLTHFERYKYLLNDYTHILSKHMDQEKELNDMNGAVIYSKTSQLVKCDVNSCPFYSRDPLNASSSFRYLHSPSLSALSPPNGQQARRTMTQSEVETLVFYRNILNTIHCYFLHPFHTGFQMVKSSSFEERAANTGSASNVNWNDQELHHLQRELYDRSENLRSVRDRKQQYYQYSKFIIDIPDKTEKTSIGKRDDDDKKVSAKDSKNKSKMKSKAKLKSKHALSMQNYFGARYYYWKWYKKHDKEDWRCNPGRSFKELYIAPKYDNIKDEILQNKHCSLKPSEWNRALIKATNYLKSSQVIRGLKSEGNALLHYGIEDGENIKTSRMMIQRTSHSNAN